MSKSLLAIRHVGFEDLGGFEAPLREAGYAIEYADMGVDDIAGLTQPDLLVILGGPIGAYEENLYPWLTGEIAFLADRLKAQRPTLGICLGAQLMARALGAKVYPGRAKEIGWRELTLTAAGQTRLASLAGHKVLHWHGDTFDIPHGAENLASTPDCDHQAFACGRHALAFQFHPEAQREGFERWLIGHTGEIAATPGVSVTSLREDMAREGEGAIDRGRAVLAHWLAQLP